jgi:hypothetical protein
MNAAEITGAAVSPPPSGYLMTPAYCDLPAITRPRNLHR